MTIIETDWEPFERLIGYSFKDRSHLEEAMTHTSYANEENRFRLLLIPHNERLEFLGDAVLSLSISTLLMERYPTLGEGDLSRRRAALVNAGTLAILARSLQMDHFIRLGKGEEKSEGRRKESILANAYEALIAAIYCDGGFAAVHECIASHFDPLLLERMEERGERILPQDYKTALQEKVQAIGWPLPAYRMVRKEGPDHDRLFTIALEMKGLDGVVGKGKSKKAAEQEAARAALEKIATHVGRN